MSQIPSTSLTSLHNLNASENHHNSPNTSQHGSMVDTLDIAIPKDEEAHKTDITQVTINLDEVFDQQVIHGDKFKIRITEEESHDDQYSKLIKIKIIIPRGTFSNHSNVDSCKEEEEQVDKASVHSKEGFKHEDFTAMPHRFVDFANTLIEAASTEFDFDRMICSSPIKKLAVKNGEEDPKFEKLNNAADVPSDKEIKLVEYIKNTSVDSFDLQSIGSESMSACSEELPICFTAESNKYNCEVVEKNSNRSVQLSDGESTEKRSQNKNILQVEKNNYYNDLRKRRFYNGNLRNIAFNNSFSDNPENTSQREKYQEIINSSIENVLRGFSASNMQLSELQEDNFKRMVNSSVNCPPIMGKHALLAKSNARKHNENSSQRDSEIIEELVRERFQEFLTDYYKRSYRRSLCKRNSYNNNNEDGDDISCLENKNNEHIEIHTISAEEECADNEIEELTESNSDQYQNANRIHRRSHCSSDPGFVSEGSSSKICTMPEVCLSHASSVSTFRSRSFGEILESGLLDDLDDTNLESNTEYDPAQFLTEALGGHINASFHDDHFEKTSSMGTIYSRRQTQSADHSIGTSEMSALLSTQTSTYGTYSEIPMRCSSKTMNSINEEEMDASTSSHAGNDSHNDAIMSELMKESAVQFQKIQQVSKALSLCKSIKEFECGIEQLEAEKILLTATCQREVILQEMKKIQREEIFERDEDFTHKGSISLTDFKFPAKPNDNQDADDVRKYKEYTQWFMCVVNCGKTQFATNAAVADPDGDVQFNAHFVFDDLRPDFEVEVAIYSMKMKSSIRNYSHESKYHLNKGTKATCPSPHKFLSLRRKSTSKLPEPTLKPSSYTLWGKATIKISDLSRTSTFKMTHVPRCSTISDTFSVTIASSVMVDEQFTGFLDIGTESEGSFISWNRRWCVLHNTELKYWNYPCEEGDGPPVHSLDLRSCANSWISVVDRSICARPKTLLLETMEGERITRHFLSSATLDDMKKWEKVLNSVVSSLRMWHCMKRPLVAEDENKSS